ncbi:unnamed protein product [Vicia faba]|nr:unnamed protein product [Vicia faba]
MSTKTRSGATPQKGSKRLTSGLKYKAAANPSDAEIFNQQIKEFEATTKAFLRKDDGSYVFQPTGSDVEDKEETTAESTFEQDAKTVSEPTAVLDTFNASSLLDDLSRHIASSSQRQEQLEAKLASIVGTQEVMAAKQDVMEDQLKNVITRQDEMSSDLKAVLEILKQNPRF